MKYKLLTILFLISIAAAAVLSFFPIDTICDANAGCAVVNKSGYNEVFGIENSRLGLVAFIALLAVTFSHMAWPKKEKEILIIGGILIATLVALYFIYLQAFVIGAFCKFCMVVDVSSVLALFVILYFGRDKK